MSNQIYINLPVTDLTRSITFYKALGFTKNPDFSDDNACSMKWSDEIIVMLLTHDFYKTFLRDKTVAETAKTSGVLLALSLESKEAVQRFADTAKANGGDYFQIETGVSTDMMFGYEVEDPDGNTWEPLWMSPDFIPNA